MLPQQQSAAAAEALWSLLMLAQLLQHWLGSGVGEPGPTRWLPLRWTVHGRLSLWARGQAALQEEDPAIQTWLRTRLALGAARVQTTAPPRRRRPVRLTDRARLVAC